MKIQITSNGTKIGTVSPDDFKRSIQAPKNSFLPDAVNKWNDHKAKLGEPERAEIIL